MNLTFNIHVTVNVNVFLGPTLEQLAALREPAQQAMADAFHGVVMANFGSEGFDRPHDWQELSPAYARRVGRHFATLYVTGALKDTVQKDSSNPEAATVTMRNTASVPYALAHHHGNPPNYGWTQRGSGELPARRVFPLDPATDKVTDKTATLCVEQARDAVRRALK